MALKLPPLNIGPLALALLVCAGCNQETGSRASADSGQVLAVVGTGTITVEEFKARLSEQPAFVRARFDSPEKKRELLDNLIQQELLAQEARRRGVDKDPEIQATLEKLMVQKLVRTVAESSVGTVEEAEVRKSYEANLDEYRRPERVQVSHLLIAADRADPKREQKKARAVQLLTELKASQGAAGAQVFEARARALSDDAASRDQGGDLGARTQEELAALMGPALAEAAFGLRTVGELSGVIETDKGFHLLKLQARQAKTEQPFESVKSRIENRLLAERRSQALDAFITGMRAQSKVEVREDVLKTLDVQP
jgi:parvulin-like peptidyl-prolyl isomerase